MKRRGDAVRYTAEEIDEMLTRGERRTDWAAGSSLLIEQVTTNLAATVQIAPYFHLREIPLLFDC